MSHEIRTPLNAIIGMSDSLKDENLSEEVLEVVEDIESAADGLNQLLSHTLDHAKLVSNKMELDLHKTNIRDLIETCYRLWRPQCSVKKITLKKHIDENLSQDYQLDQFRLQQCLNNLLANAVKFTSTGRIDIVVKQTLHNNNQSLVIAVKDTGIGMSEDQVAAVFDDFSQADNSIARKYGGTGLGMSITKKLTELMNGEIKVRSQKGKGTTFALIIPLKANDVSVPTKPIRIEKNQDFIKETNEEIAPFTGLRVLCVEDNPINQKVVGRLIGKRVESLTYANNGREALDILSTMEIDIVLMGIHMPIMDGIEATLEIRSSNEPWANVIIIALTADPEYQTKRICKNIGMNDSIAKPVKRADILNAFDRTLRTISSNFALKVKLTG